MTRVTIAAHHPVCRVGVRSLLAHMPGLQVVAEAGDSDTALAMVSEQRPDILVLHGELPPRGALHVLRGLTTSQGNTRVIVIAATRRTADTQSALALGASAVLPTEQASELLSTCVHRLVQGSPLPPTRPPTAGQRASASRRPPPDAKALTARESDVVRLVALGRSNKEIASHLRLAEQTVKNHLRSIFRKLEASSRVELALSTHQAAAQRLLDR